MYDPKALDNAHRLFPTANMRFRLQACERADTVLVLTEWREFIDLEPADLANRVRARAGRPQLPDDPLAAQAGGCSG